MKLKSKNIMILRLDDGIRFTQVLSTLENSFLENILTCKRVKDEIS